MRGSNVSSNDPKSARELGSLVLLTAVIAAIASFLVCEIYDLDSFWNVAIGKDIIAHGEVPSLDRYTAAGLGHGYVDIHWLFQVAAAASQMAMGWEGVQLLAAEHLTTLRIPPLRWRKARASDAALVILASCWYPLSGRYYLEMEIPARFGLGVTPSFFPRGLPRFLDRIGHEGQVFNSNSIGGFYLFHGFPERLPLTEGRWTAYEEETVTTILQAPSRPELWARVSDEYSIDALLLHHTSPEARALLPLKEGCRSLFLR